MASRSTYFIFSVATSPFKRDGRVTLGSKKIFSAAEVRSEKVLVFVSSFALLATPLGFSKRVPNQKSRLVSHDLSFGHEVCIFLRRIGMALYIFYEVSI